MRISLLQATTSYPLAGEEGVGEREHSSAAGFELTGETRKQAMAYVRGSLAREKDRGNLLHTITFSTTRLFDSHAEASLFALAYDAAVPREGTLVIENIGADGGVESTLHLLDAVVSPPRRRLTGCTLFLDYTVTGGAINQVSGVAPTFWEDLTPFWEEL